MRLILPAGQIPADEWVTKLRGSARFLLRDKVTVYQQDGSRQEISAEPGCRFLVNPERADINAIPADRELVWETDPETVAQMIEEGLFETDEEGPLA